jgi:Uma2 family endonuclease
MGNRLEGKPCVVYNSDLRVKVQSAGWYTYPDISVVCGKSQLEGGDVLLNPILLVEVLSKATEGYDRGKKFELYAQLPSLREYLLVNQHRPRVEQYVRQDNGGWLLQASNGMDSAITLASLQITVPLVEVYANVEFEPEPLHSQKPSASPPL